MIVCDSVRCLAFTSLVLAVARGEATFAQILVVGLVDGTGYVFVSLSERSALKRVVAEGHLAGALARNQAREYSSLLAGQPLGGVLFGLSRQAPFLFNAASYLVSVATLALVRTDLRGGRPERRHLGAEIREGLAWFWRQPFMRTTSLLVTGSDFTLNALYVVVIVLARQRGASPALIGAMFAFIGVGGVAGATLASRLARVLSVRAVVIGTMSLTAALVPLLAALPGRVTPGVVFGAMFVLHPTWAAVVGAYRLRITPDELQGRVQSVATLLSLGLVPFALLAAGFSLDYLGSTPSVLILLGVMVVVSASAVVSRAVREAEEIVGSANLT